jgi:hypothetical protein
MKKLFFCVLFAIFSVVVSAQKKIPTENDSIVFENTVYDFGSMNKGSKATCEFTFTNKGKKFLTINQVHPVCACTEVEWSKKPIAPGEVGHIKVIYNTQLTGGFSKAITVHSTAANSLVVLVVNGAVLPEE